MRNLFLQNFLLITLVTISGNIAAATSTVFTEDFTNNANWLSGSFTALTEIATGGPDGSSYVSLDAAFNNIGQGTIYRGHDGFDASGDAFVGNWIDDGYTALTAFVRHNAPVSLNYFARLASPNNFPGAGVDGSVSVPPNTWTEISFDVQQGSPKITTFEGSDYNTVFSNIGNVQLAVSVPVGFENDARVFAFDLDKVSLAVPEPTSLLLLVAGSLATCALRRKSLHS